MLTMKKGRKEGVKQRDNISLYSTSQPGRIFCSSAAMQNNDNA